MSPRGYMHPGWVDIGFDKVKPAVERYVRENAGGRLEWDSYGPPRWIAEYMALYCEPNTPSWPGYKFSGQVKRALDQLADEGKLVKVGKGTGRGSSVVYFTPQRHQEMLDRQAADESRQEAVRQRWEAVNAALAANNAITTGMTWEPPHLGLHTWERLLGLVQDPAVGEAMRGE